MKKMLILSVFWGVSSFSAMAQDDMYFKPEKKPVVPVKVVQVKETSERDVDEYNRHGHFSNYVMYPSELDSLMCDTIEFHSGIDSLLLRPDSFHIPQRDRDYQFSRSVSRFDESLGDDERWERDMYYRLHSPWGSGPSYWYDPWYYGYGGWYDTWRYSIWYDPWYYGYGYGGWYAPYTYYWHSPFYGVTYTWYGSPDYRPGKNRHSSETSRWIRDNRKTAVAHNGRSSSGYTPSASRDPNANPGDRSNRVSRRRSAEGVSGRSSRSSRRTTSSYEAPASTYHSNTSSYSNSRSYNSGSSVYNSGSSNSGGGSSYNGGGGSYGGGGSRSVGGFSHGGRR